MPLNTQTLVNPHWRARLLDVQDQAMKAVTVEELALAIGQLTALLHDEWDGHTYPTVQLVQLVQEAYDLLTNPDTRVDLKDWTRAAKTFIPS